MNRYLRPAVAAFYLAHLAVTPLSANPDPTGPTLLNDVRLEDGQVVLDMSQLMPYDVFTLSSPWRLVVEIPGTVYKASFARKNVEDPLVRRIRGYQFKENPPIARVVLDLKAPVDYRTTAGDSQISLTLRKNEVLAETPATPEPPANTDTRATVRPRSLLDSLPREVISLDFEGADIRDVIRLMSETSNINMIFGPEVSGNISIHLKRVPFSEAFQTILNLRGLVASQLGANILRITTPENIQQDRTKAIVYTRVLPVNYIDAAAMRTHIQSVMETSGRKGTITVVRETNSLVVTDSRDGLEQAERLIRQLDEKPRQVMIESRIVEINLNNGFDIGVQWEFSDSTMKTNSLGDFESLDYFGLRGEGARVTAESTVPGFPNDVGPFGPGQGGTGVSLPGPTAAGITFGFVKSDQMLSATLAALITNSQARILSSPKVVTINGEEARIEAVQDIPFRTSTVSGTGVVSNSFESVKAGIILTVKPVINADNRITLQIAPESSFPTTGSTEAGPIIRSRLAKTTVIIRDGETLVIGGLIDDQDSKGVSKVPILGDIPIIGAFFRSQSNTKIRNELLVFVTPRIIRD